MKHFALYLGIAAGLVASCSTKEIDIQTPVQDDVVFYAYFEQPGDEGTKVYANEDLLLRWTADDRVSIFNKITYNQEYKFIGETGDYEGGFNKVDDPEFMTGKVIPDIISVYPFQRQTRVAEDETITLTLPAEQHYAENSFGLGANTMVSVTSNNLLQYKNVGGYLVLRLYGEGVLVSSISLKGNNGEKLVGNATITMPLDGVPSVEMASDATDEITLVCDSPVLLGSTPEESTAFWFVVPPVTFSNGFTVSINQWGGVSERSTQNKITIERSTISKMARMEVERIQPNNVLLYTTTDGNIVLPLITYDSSMRIVSNEIVNGLGIITFDGDLTCIDSYAFYVKSTLKSVYLPDEVKSIEEGAFSNCHNLISIRFPNGLKTIGDNAFIWCEKLSGLNLPDELTSIGWYAFGGCSSITSIFLPENIASIGDAAFMCCSSLRSFSGKYASSDGLFLINTENDLIAIAGGAIDGDVSIPGGIERIGCHTFRACSKLTGVTIPIGLTSIDDGAFTGCDNLVRINFPAGLASIGDYAFSSCKSLASVTFPAELTSIGEAAFAGCTSMVAFSGKYASSDGLFVIVSDSIIAAAVAAIGGDLLIPEGITSIGTSAFNRCSGLTGVSFPTGLISIGDFAFYGCPNLMYIALPEELESIGSEAFSDCSNLTTVTLPAGIKRIGSSAFSRSSNLSSITVLAETPPTGSNGMFNDTNNCPIYVPSGSVTKYKAAQYWSGYADRIRCIPDYAGHDFVDLGLSVKWATCNVGASSPEKYGDYFAWGETSPKSFYYWDSYIWCKGGENTLTKYNTNSNYGTVDNKTALDLNDDAAHVNWGGSWRLPTYEEQTELRTQCSWEWTTENGVQGRKVTGPNGNSIFLPAAGYRSNKYLYDDGFYGNYMSSSLYSDNPSRFWAVYFGSNFLYVSYTLRCLGYSVRPVSE